MTTKVGSGMTTGVVKTSDKASIVSSSTSSSNANKVIQCDSTGKIPAIYIPSTSTNTPMFSVQLSADQAASGLTKIQFNTEVIDTDNAFDNSSNYRFTVPSGKAGKYFISFDIHVANSATDAASMDAYLYKNGAAYKQVNQHVPANGIKRAHLNLVCIEDSSEGDYYEVYAGVNGTNPIVEGGTATFGSSFMGYKLLT